MEDYQIFDGTCTGKSGTDSITDANSTISETVDKFNLHFSSVAVLFYRRWRHHQARRKPDQCLAGRGGLDE